MDAALINKTRKFPAYTLKELRNVVARYEAGEHVFSTAETIAAIKTEIAAREAGTSKPLVVPQITPLSRR